MQMPRSQERFGLCEWHYDYDWLKLLIYVLSGGDYSHQYYERGNKFYKDIGLNYTIIRNSVFFVAVGHKTKQNCEKLLLVKF